MLDRLVVLVQSRLFEVPIGQSKPLDLLPRVAAQAAEPIHQSGNPQLGIGVVQREHRGARAITEQHEVDQFGRRHRRAGFTIER
ncbi:Uncharacterised protein [Mycobacteroides abscessus subsp. abscessus]|nr:Uncharacterised protein [Mycobacteroides abscessus subsp. abscessus]SIL47167.1 Uncharacterised protein [Mycobacteroides abscessus subsp. abscessus]